MFGAENKVKDTIVQIYSVQQALPKPTFILLILFSLYHLAKHYCYAGLYEKLVGDRIVVGKLTTSVREAPGVP